MSDSRLDIRAAVASWPATDKFKGPRQSHSQYPLPCAPVIKHIAELYSPLTRALWQRVSRVGDGLHRGQRSQRWKSSLQWRSTDRRPIGGAGTQDLSAAHRASPELMFPSRAPKPRQRVLRGCARRCPNSISFDASLGAYREGARRRSRVPAGLCAYVGAPSARH